MVNTVSLERSIERTDAPYYPEARVDAVRRVLLSTLATCSEQAYSGWDKHDGISTPLLQRLPVRSRLVNFCFQEAVKRAPFNLRPLLFMEKRRSFKGISLFALAYFNLYRLTGNEELLTEGISLTEWLLDNAVPGYAGFCGAHRHDRQQRDRFVPAGTPAIVPTSLGVQALLSAYELSSEARYRDAALSSARFIYEDLDYRVVGDEARIKYKPGDGDRSFTLNANALGARVFLALYRVSGDVTMFNAAERILNFVVSKQCDNGGWMYTEPPSSSHLSMDNYHNGFIIESLLDYREVATENKFADSLERAIGFFSNRLFNPDGSPNWDERSDYPKDIHACAGGIIVASRLRNRELSEQIVSWTFNNLYDGRGSFYYQKRRLFVNKSILMRWGQAWMCFALSMFLLSWPDDVAG